MNTQTQERPALRAFRKARRMTQAEVAEIGGVSAIQVGRYELPFTNKRRQVPREEVMRRFIDWSDGELKPADFYPTELTREPGSPEREPRP